MQRRVTRRHHDKFLRDPVTLTDATYANHCRRCLSLKSTSKPDSSHAGFSHGYERQNPRPQNVLESRVSVWLEYTSVRVPLFGFEPTLQTAKVATEIELRNSLHDSEFEKLPFVVSQKVSPV
jgi:hypothetical protein